MKMSPTGGKDMIWDAYAVHGPHPAIIALHAIGGLDERLPTWPIVFAK